ncbi:MAG: hypothetical protein EBZ77_14790, partial [Chitinophagia bacterium]|nr:hypothetical protein [Chitinophagia bacterium]
MADINAIRTISLAFENPGSMGEDEATIANRYAEKYPYFIPVKYMLAYQKNQADSANPDVLADIYPYLGNWLQLYSFLKGKAFPKTVYELGGTHAHDDEEEKTTYQVDTPEVLAAHPEEPNNYEATVDSQADTGANSNNNWWTEQTDHLSPLAGQPTTNTNELPEEIAAEASELPLAYAAYLGNNEQSTQEASETVAEATETSALTNEPLMNYDIPLFTPPSGEDYFRQQGIS